MTENSPLDADGEGFEAAFDAADDAAYPHIQEYYASLTPDMRGSGFFDTRLETFHIGPNLPEDRTFYSAPKSLTYLQDPSNTPMDHPLRAIAWILFHAAPNSTVRVFCYSLTDPIAIDLLIHAGATRTVQVILHPNDKSRKAMKDFVEENGKKSFLENMEIRLANLTGSPCESRLVQMHDKSIITESYTTYGSYNLSSFARVGNWESLCVMDTSPKNISVFDGIWANLRGREVERFYGDLQSTVVGPRRAARRLAEAARDAEAARLAAAARDHEEQEQQGGHEH